MIKINEIIIVEGKYDKIKLSRFIKGIIIETNGFRIFNDKNKQQMIRNLAKKRGIIVLTDSDSGGFVIRNFLKSILPNCEIKQAYIPEILGKEKRKESVSKQGLLGVEGIEDEIIKKALSKHTTEVHDKNEKVVTKVDFFVDGLSGGENSQKRRDFLINYLKLPKYITTNALLDYVNVVMSFDEYKSLINSFKNDV